MKSSLIYISFAIALFYGQASAAPLLGGTSVTADGVNAPAIPAQINSDHAQVAGVEADGSGVRTQQDKASLVRRGLGGIAATPEGVDVAPAGLQLSNDAERDPNRVTDSSLPDAVSKLIVKRDGSSDDDGEDLFNYGQYRGAYQQMRPASPVDMDDIYTKRDGSSDDDGEDLLRSGRQVTGSRTQMTPAQLKDSLTKRDGSSDDDGEDLLRPGRQAAGSRTQMTPAQLKDSLTKRGEEEEEEEEEGESDDVGSNGENTPDAPGRPPPGLTAEQLDDFKTKRDSLPIYQGASAGYTYRQPDMTVEDMMDEAN